MHWIATQVIMCGIGVIAAVSYSGDVTPIVVIGMLIAWCVSSAQRVMVPNPRIAVAIGICFCLCALGMPSWLAFAPMVCSSAAWRVAFARQPAWIAAIVPIVQILVVMLWMVRWQQSALMSHRWGWLSVTGALSVLSTAVMWEIAHMQQERDRRQATIDEQRDRIRRQHMRIDMLQERQAQSVIQATLQERTRIARDIHDNVGHALTRAIMQIEAEQVVCQANHQPELAQRFADIGASVHDAMTMVRNAVHNLHDDGNDFAAQVDAVVHALHDDRLTIAVHNTIQTLPTPVAYCFTAAIREALTNSMKHGNAQHVDIRLRELPGLWQCVIQDDGRGGNLRTAPRTRDVQGIGLIDVEERARALGGTASCGWYHEGWRVFIAIPKPKEEKYDAA